MALKRPLYSSTVFDLSSKEAMLPEGQTDKLPMMVWSHKLQICSMSSERSSVQPQKCEMFLKVKCALCNYRDGRYGGLQRSGIYSRYLLPGRWVCFRFLGGLNALCHFVLGIALLVGVSDSREVIVWCPAMGWLPIQGCPQPSACSFRDWLRSPCRHAYDRRL